MEFRLLDQEYGTSKENFYFFSDFFAVVMIFWKKMCHHYDNAEIVSKFQ